MTCRHKELATPFKNINALRDEWQPGPHGANGGMNDD
jgi:hypothetical protein